jgi:segregation and condensation protein B
MPDARTNKENDLAALEGVLFVLGEAVSMVKLAQILDSEKKETEVLVRKLSVGLENDPARGLMVLRDGENAQLVTKPSVKDPVGKAVKDALRENLTPAALETLTLTAYAGPLTRAEIDYLRGVNSAFTLRNLLVRGLLERDHDGKSAGSAYLYKTTPVFLRHLGLKMIQEMPGYPEQRNLIRNFIPHLSAGYSRKGAGFISKENGNVPQLPA